MQELLGWGGNPTGRTSRWWWVGEDPRIAERLAAVIDEVLVDKPRITATSAAELAAALAEAL
jgi:hypothetical protein